MKKKYKASVALSVNEEDIKVHYMVTKNPDTNPDMKLLVSGIYAYVQSNEIYFDYEINFHEGVLIFGIIGFESDHKKLQDELGDVIEKLNCKLQWQFSDSMGITHSREQK